MHYNLRYKQKKMLGYKYPDVDRWGLFWDVGSESIVYKILLQ